MQELVIIKLLGSTRHWHSGVFVMPSIKCSLAGLMLIRPSVSPALRVESSLLAIHSAALATTCPFKGSATMHA
jgi:hypothetical protein